MAEGTGAGTGAGNAVRAYKVTRADTSSPESLAKSYEDAAAQAEISASVWDGKNVNIITHADTHGTNRKFRVIQAKSGSAEELENSLTEATRDGGHIVSTVWDGNNVNVVIEIEYV